MIRFSGRAGKQAVEEMTDRLLGVLGQEHIRVAGTPFLMRYNPPFMPGFLRRNEVGVEIRRDGMEEHTYPRRTLPDALRKVKIQFFLKRFIAPFIIMEKGSLVI